MVQGINKEKSQIKAFLKKIIANVLLLFLFLGENDRNKPENNEQQFQIHSGDIFLHPEFNHSNLDNDLAVIKLATKAKITPYVIPVS